MSENCMNHIESYWERLTIKGNEYYKNGNYSEALNNYQNAIYRAEVLNNHLNDCMKYKIPFLQIYIISCNNLSNTYQELGDIEKAEKMIKKTFYFLLYIASLNIYDLDEIQSEIKNVVLFYTQFMKENKMDKVEQIDIIKSLKEKILKEKLIA